MQKEVKGRALRALMTAALFVVFTASFVVTAAAQGGFGGIGDPDGSGGSTCYKPASGCNYNVTSWTCFDSCPFSYGYNCCYIEQGRCIDDPGRVVSSSICGGLCCH